MDETSITTYLLETFDHVRTATVLGDTFFYYNPDPQQPDEHYFASLKSDDDYDNASNLNRPGFFRLNIGVGKETYFSLFESGPARPSPDGDFDQAWDFTAADQLMPHPTYGRQYWVSVVNPSAETFAALRPLLAEAYGLVVAKVGRL